MKYAEIKFDENTENEKIASVHHGDSPPKKGKYLPIEEDSVNYNQITQYIKEKKRSEWTIENDKVIVTYDIFNKDLSEQKDKIISEIKEKRDSVIKNGVTIKIGDKNYRFTMDSETISRIDQARLDSKERPTNWQKRWKISDGVWVNINASNIEKIRSKGADHMEACFTKHEQLETSVVNAQSVDELLSIDIQSDWPDGT